MRNGVNRRDFLTGQADSGERMTAIASAVVSVMPRKRDELLAALAALPRTEIRAAEGAKVVVVMEGRTRDEIGERLAHIAMMEGVIAANMVFEHADYREDMS